MADPSRKPLNPRYRWAAVAAGALSLMILLSIGLAWVATGFQGVSGWGAFLGLFALGAAILVAGWWALRGEHPPAWLGGVLLGAAVLRLALGVVWFVGLPVLGHGSPSETAGYVMADARERDRAAWDLAQSRKPLWTAFQGGYRKADQYGGLLFLSGLVYRTLRPPAHYPLLMVILTACVSSLAVLFTWGLAKRAWGAQVAGGAAWMMALFPEAVLLGSSQMREAFTITLVAAAFYGLLRYWQERAWTSLAWTLAAVLLFIPFSPPFAALLALFLVIAAAGLWQHNRLQAHSRLWVLVVLVVIVVLVGAWIALAQFGPAKLSNPLEVVSWWARKSADYQAYLSKRASGWVQKIFGLTPEWTHAPMLITYGVFQPFLPAALGTTSAAPIWTWITLWRALGWAPVLALLIYAPLRALRSNHMAGFNRALSLIVWLGILIASFRGGGDLSDNPRYRATFTALQIALASWALLAPRRAGDPWLRRVLVSTAITLTWFLPWYLRRYYHITWPVGDLFATLGLGLASAALFLIWDWARLADGPPPKS